jgi:hypothetical protein
MHQVNLQDAIYEEARRRAETAGFSNVDEYLADLLAHDFQLDHESMDHLFTPERLALIDQAAADVAKGDVHTMDQLKEELTRTRDAWLRERAGEK